MYPEAALSQHIIEPPFTAFTYSCFLQYVFTSCAHLETEIVHIRPFKTAVQSFLSQKVQFWSHLTRETSSTFAVSPTNYKRFMVFFQQCLPSSYSSIKVRFVEFTTNSCPVNRFSHLRCGSLQLLQIYHGLLGCFSD